LKRTFNRAVSVLLVLILIGSILSGCDSSGFSLREQRAGRQHDRDAIENETRQPDARTIEPPVQERESFQHDELAQNLDIARAYDRLLQEISILPGYSFALEANIDVSPVLSSRFPTPKDKYATAECPSKITVSGNVSDLSKRMQIDYTEFYPNSWAPRHLEKIYTDRDVYMDLDLLFIEGVSVEPQFVMASYADMGVAQFPEPSSLPPTHSIDLKTISMAENTATVMVAGNEAMDILNDIVDMFVHFSKVSKRPPMINNLRQALSSAKSHGELPGAEAVITISGTRGSYRQSIGIVIPGFLDMTTVVSYEQQVTGIITSPRVTFSWEDHNDMLFKSSRFALFDRERSAISIEDVEIVYDLPEVNIINHILPRDSLFESITYESNQGVSYRVLRPIERVRDGEGIITHDGPRVAYFAHYVSPFINNFDPVVFLEELLKDMLIDASEYQPNAPIRTNEDRSTAFLHVRFSVMMEEGSRFFIAQRMQGTNEILVFHFWIWAHGVDYFSDERLAAVVELGQLTGIDFLEYLDGVPVFEW